MGTANLGSIARIRAEVWEDNIRLQDKGETMVIVWRVMHETLIRASVVC